jgi:hypothetical protein
MPQSQETDPLRPKPPSYGGQEGEGNDDASGLLSFAHCSNHRIGGA